MFNSSSFSQFLYAFFSVLKEHNAKLVQTQRSSDNRNKLFICVLAVLVLAVSLLNVGIVNAQTFQLQTPWDSGQYWVPQTYDLHWGGAYGSNWDEARNAVDFYWADPQESGIFGRGPETGRGKNVRVTHNGIAQIQRLYCSPEVEQSNVIVSDDSQQLKTEYIHLEPNTGIQIGDSVVINNKGIGRYLRNCTSTNSINCPVIAEMPDGTKMTVIGGSDTADGYIWWELKGYVNGSLKDGWSASNIIAYDYNSRQVLINSLFHVNDNIVVYPYDGVNLRPCPEVSSSCSPIASMSSGTQLQISYEEYYGFKVSVQTADGYTWWKVTSSLYGSGWVVDAMPGNPSASLDYKPVLGKQVSQGAVLGKVSNVGCAKTPHLMFIVYDGWIPQPLDNGEIVNLGGEVIFSGLSQTDWASEYGTIYTYSSMLRGATDPPVPLIASKSIDKPNVLVDEPFTITVSGENIGGSAAVYGGITVQVRQAYTVDVEVSESHLASGAIADQSVWWKGDTLGNGSTPPAAQYLHVEPTWYDWTASSTKMVQVTITPHQTGTYDIYAKMYFYDGSSYPRDPSGNTPYTDHQNEGTYFLGTVTVNPSCTDSDNDGYSPEGGTCGSVDCDDNDPDRSPGNSETCNDAKDNDCDGSIDSFDSDCGAVTYYCDNDNDGYINKSVTGTCLGNGCQPGGCLTNPGNDCDDSDLSVNPVAIEGLVNEVSCSDTKDNDCDGLTDSLDSDCKAVKYYCDDDNDGYINKSVTDTCLGDDCQPEGCLTNSGNDCNDSDLSVNPGEIEGLVNDGSCNDTKDNDCDGAIDSDDTGCIDLSIPEPDITVIDTVGDTGDLNVSFGNLTNGNSSERNVTVRNDGAGDLIIGNIAENNSLDDPFNLQGDNCSGKTLETSDSCTITIRFSPDTDVQFDDSFDIPSNDPNEDPVIFSVSGTGFSEEIIPDNRPASFDLVYPAYWQADLPTSLQFIWKKYTDPEGSSLTYTLYYCTDSKFLNCNTKVVASSISHENKNLFYGSVAGNWLVLLVGLALIGGCKGRKEVRVGALIAILIIGGALLPACGDNGGGNAEETPASEETLVSDSDASGTTQPMPKSDEFGKTVSDLRAGTTYYWQVVAKDGNVEKAKSEVWSFTTK